MTAPACEDIRQLIPFLWGRTTQWFNELMESLPPDAKSLTYVDPFEGEVTIRFEPIEEQPEP